MVSYFNEVSKYSNITKEEQQGLESAKWKLWHGLGKDCFSKLTVVISQTEYKKIKDRLQKLLEYLENNEDILVNYEERKSHKLALTSNIAESTVENLVNSRYRQTGKMQWRRKGGSYLIAS